MINNQKIEADARENKVKEGLLIKRSRHLKQWKERWMVLTKTHLYSFSAKGQYKNPTEIISLKDVETIKSYYKDQYNKPFIFRVQSEEVNLHMSAKNNDEKWAWMTAIQKMIERIVHPNDMSDTYNMIRETIKMSTAVRQTLQKKEQSKIDKNSDLPENLFKKLKVGLNQQVVSVKILPTSGVLSSAHRQTIEEETFFKVQQKEKQKQKSKSKYPPITIPEQKRQQKKISVEKQKKISVEKQKKISDEKQKSSEQPAVKIVEKVVQRIVEVPVEKIVIHEVKVPEIQVKYMEKIVEKIVYLNGPTAGEESSQSGSKQQALNQVLTDLLEQTGENPKPITEFVVYLMTSSNKQYHESILQFCLTSPAKKTLTESFLLMMNSETEEQKFNLYLKFILILYENCNQYFYTTDVKVLIDILLRALEMNISQFNQYLVMMVLKTMAEKDWWAGLNHRRKEIIAYVKELESISGPENQYLAKQLLTKL